MAAEVNELAAHLQAVAEDVADIKTAMRDVSLAVVQLARLEERHSSTDKALGQAFDAIRDHGFRIKVLEERAPIHNLVSGWILAALGGAVGIAGTIFINKALGG